MLDELSPVPLYHQLKDVVRSRIESGQWQVGQPIPTEAELCEEFDVSRATVTRAMQALVRDGFIRRRRGKGNYASRPRLSHDLLSFSSFSEYAKRQVGKELASRTLSVTVKPASMAMAEALEINECDPVVEIRRLRLAESQPVFLATLNVPEARCPGLLAQDLTGSSVIELIQERYHLRITRVKASFEAVSIGEEDARLLELEKGAPVLLFHRLRFTGDGRPLMASDHLIRSDLFHLSLDITSSASR
jgi:GntR family transcriptional regulator